jgi:two-component system chemotaxis sensor kinase CheA
MQEGEQKLERRDSNLESAHVWPSDLGSRISGFFVQSQERVVVWRPLRAGKLLYVDYRIAALLLQRADAIEPAALLEIPLPTLEQIAAEVVLLSPEDTAARLRLEQMLRGVAQSGDFAEPVRDLAWQALAAVQSLIQVKEPDAVLKQLNQLLDQMILLESKPEQTADAPIANAPGEIVDERLLQEFLRKQDSVLEEFEAQCLALEKGDTESFPYLKRQIHTWKGEAGIVGFPDLSRMMHDIEEALQNSDSMALATIADALLHTGDQLKAYFKARLNHSECSLNVQSVLSMLVEQPQESAPAAPAAVASEKSGVFELPTDIDTELLTEFCNESEEHFQHAEQALMALESDPSDTEAVNVVFRAFHTVKGTSGFVGLGCVTELAHKAETFFDRFRKGTLVMEGTYTDLAFEALDMLKEIFGGIGSALASGLLPLPALYPDLLRRLEAQSGQTAPSAGAVVVQSKQTSASTATATSSSMPEASGKSEESARAKRTQQDGETDGLVKVSTGRLDNFINMVGELVIAQSMVSQDPTIQQGTDQRLVRNVSQLNKITRSLQELALSMRMVSVKATFQKMARLARDLARKSGKDILFETEGEETELDRNMVEAIADPLVHMVRNAADHGVEPPEEREEAGKPRQGRILLRAAHEGGSVVITLSDDGRGLNKQKILAKAVERGLIDAGAQLSDAEICNLIFAPGFSTADKVTDISGRGVGMDVVRTNVEALRGTVDIRSKPGEGSVFSVRLPLTLAIIDGMVVRVGSERFILPITAITETFQPRTEDVSTVQQQSKLVMLRGSLIPVCRLGRLFAIEDAGDDLAAGILVVIESKGRRIAIMVDELLGQQQIVIKSLGSMFRRVQGVSGGAILGDGRISLILDVDGLARLSSGVSEA